MIRCRCTATCQFKGNVAEKGELHMVEEWRLEDDFVRRHFKPVGMQQQISSKPDRKSTRKNAARTPAAVSASDLPFMREGV